MPPDAWTLRAAEAADAPAVAALHAASWRASYRGSFSDAYLDGPIDAERALFWHERLSHPRPGLVTLLGEDGGGRIAGFVCALVDHDPGLGLPLGAAPDYLKVELVYGASHEGALHLDDLLARRTRISIETEDRGSATAEEVARLVAPVLGWSRTDELREVEHYRARVAAERESQDQPDDLTADAARLGAPDVRTAPSTV